MQVLLEQDTEALLNRFYQCADGVIRELRLDLGSSTRGPCGFVELSTRDSEVTKDDGWTNLRLLIENLLEFRLSKGDREDCAVLSNGIRIRHFGDRVFLDLGTDDLDSATPDDLRASSFYLAGEAIRWESVAYRE